MDILHVNETKYLDEAILGQPVAAMYLVSRELGRLSGYVTDMLSSLRACVTEKDAKEAGELCRQKIGQVKCLQDKTQDYISKLFARGGLTEHQAEQTAGLLFVSNNMERIADRCQEFCNIFDPLNQEKRVFSKEAVAELDGCIESCQVLFSEAVQSVVKGDAALAGNVQKRNIKMRKNQKKLSKAHLARVKKKSCDPKLTAHVKKHN